MLCKTYVISAGIGVAAVWDCRPSSISRDQARRARAAGYPNAMSSTILARIEAQTGLPRLASDPGDRPEPSDLQSLMLHVYQERSDGLREPDLMRGSRARTAGPVHCRCAAGEPVRPCRVPDRQPDFEAVDLSPVCGLGLNRVLGEIDQNNVLTTIRNAEVLGDPTPALALECARRRRDASDCVPRLRCACAPASA